jgi:transposase
MRTFPRYTDEFKADAVDLVERSERSIPEVARDLGVSIFSLRSWYKAAQMAKKKPKRKNPAPARSAIVAPKDESLEDENRRLKRELASAQRKIDGLEMDREILKKAAAFFAKESE